MSVFVTICFPVGTNICWNKTCLAAPPNASKSNLYTKKTHGHTNTNRSRNTGVYQRLHNDSQAGHLNKETSQLASSNGKHLVKQKVIFVTGPFSSRSFRGDIGWSGSAYTVLFPWSTSCQKQFSVPRRFSHWSLDLLQLIYESGAAERQTERKEASTGDKRRDSVDE